MTTHKMRGTKEYRAWLRMKTVCYNKNNSGYKTYGARGVRMDSAWRYSFSEFYKDMGGMPEGCTGIELIDMSADFCKLNCRWVGPKNRRDLKDMPNQKNRSSVKRYRRPKKITITVESAYFEFLQRQAIEKSREVGEPISAPELIKMILEQNAPMPKQLDMFGKPKKEKANVYQNRNQN